MPEADVYASPLAAVNTSHRRNHVILDAGTIAAHRVV
jgi:hypothetical protein